MPQYELLKDADVPTLADATLEVLEKVGILCQNGEVLDALQRWGAMVDREKDVATFPRKLVEEFVAELKREFGGGEEITPSVFPKLGLPSLGTQIAQFVYDYKKKEKRPGNKEDLIKLVKFGDSLHGDNGVGHCLLLTDVPPLLEPLEAGLILAEYARKPGQPFAWNVKQVGYLVEMGEMLGIENWFTWGASCFAHPLRFEKDVVDRFVPRVKGGGSAGFTAMPVPGMTTPVTTAGFIVVSAAELVGSWIAGRALNSKAPLYGSLWGGSLDMRSGAASYCAFDGMRCAFATCELMRKWTGVTISAGGGEYCAAKAPGYFAAWEKAHKAMTIAAFTGVHPGIGQGMLEEGKTLSPVQLLLEREVTLGLQLYGKQVEVASDTIALDTIVNVGFGIGKTYIDQDHTLEHFRDDSWLPPTLDRSGYAGPEQEQAVLDKLQEKVDELIASYQKPDVDPHRLAKMREVVERARKKIGGT